MDSRKKQRKPKKRARTDSKQNDLFDSLPWNPSLSSKDGAFSFLIGSNELEGGFLSLEEIDEKEYGLDIPKPKMESVEETTVKEASKSKKGKSTLVVEVESPKVEEQEKKGESEVTEPRRKKRKRENKKKLNDTLENETDSQNKGGHVEGEVSEVKKKKKQKRKKNKKKLKESLENESDSQNKGEHGKGEVTEVSKKEQNDGQIKGEHGEGEVTELSKKEQTDSQNKGERGEDEVTEVSKKEQTDSQNRGERGEDEVTEVSKKEQTDSQNKGEHVESEVSEVKKKKKKKQKRKKNKNKLKESLENDSDSQNKGEHGEGEVTEVSKKEQTDSENKGELRKGEDMEVKEKKKKPRKKKPAKKEENSKNVTKDHAEPASDNKEDVEGEIIDETEYYAWNELRLHPQLMKSIYRLKFKEPTPIQKACIPAAAHQGKDVIGAAETGSGKTLAFGLPIVQRLLEERDKVENLIDESDEAHERITARGFLRALIITPTRELAMQVTDHIKQVVTRDTNIRVVPIVGGMSTQKQERLLKSRPEIVVGTPGRLWELMSGGSIHLMELHSLSFFVLDEADRMVESGHFRELQSIIDMLPMASGSVEGESENTENCATVSSFQRKKRQTFVFSATIALSTDFRKKLKKGSKSKQTTGLSSIETLSERAGMRENAAIVDLTSASIMAHNLEESFIECKEEDKDAYLYYILSVHGRGRAIIFCTSIAALRHMSSILRILDINVWTLHAQMQQRARLKSIDRFRENEHGVLVATDVAARGLDIPGIRTVIHYQLPHSAEVYVHRSGRTARASSDGCSIALISPNETSKFAGLCKSFAKESFQRFPTDISYMPEVMKRISLARQIDKILRKDSQDKAKKTWLEKNAESVELFLEDNDSEDERVNKHKQNKATSVQLMKLQGELKGHLSRPLQPKTFSNRYLAGAGVSPLLQKQFMEMARKKVDGVDNLGHNKRRNLVVIGQDCVEPLEALRNAGQKSVQNLKQVSDTRKKTENLKRKRKEEKKRLHEQRRKQRKKEKAGNQ